MLCNRVVTAGHGVEDGTYGDVDQWCRDRAAMRRREFGAGDPFGEAGRRDHLDRCDAAVCTQPASGGHADRIGGHDDGHRSEWLISFGATHRPTQGDERVGRPDSSTRDTHTVDGTRRV